MSKEMASLFKTIASGVCVVTTAHGERRNAFTAAWVSQVSFNPLLLVLSVNPENASYDLIMAGEAFAVNVLEEGRIDLARHFGTQSGRDRDKLAGHAWRIAATGAPILEAAVAYFDCRLQYSRPAGDHVLVVGRVVDGAILKPAAKPMTYAQIGDLDNSIALYPSDFL